MQVLFLGSGTSYGVPMIGCGCAVCGSSDPRNKRTRASILVRAQGQTLLVDATPELRQQALRERLNHLDAILITHAHADHLFGLDDVRAFSHLRKEALPLYADAAALRIIRKNFDYAINDTAFALGWGVPRLTLHEIGASARVGEVEVIAVPIFHGPWTILGFRIGGFAYLTDCNGVPDSSLPLLKNVDTLVMGALRHESHTTHFTVAEALEMIEKIAPRRAYLTHISHQLDHQATEAALPERVRLAYDGLTLDLDDPLPSSLIVETTASGRATLEGFAVPARP